MTQEELNILLKTTESDQESASRFSRQILRDWMRKNTIEGINVQQSLWLFARFEEMTISIDGIEKRIDLFKMFESGAIPTLYYCLLRIQPDDMTKSYHWLTRDRIDWITTKIELWLGPTTAAYLKSLQ